MSDDQYITPKRTQKRYEQRFRDAWLENPLLKDWLRDCYTPEGIREARCIYCDIKLCPRFIDLSKHAMTRKHLRNAPQYRTTDHDGIIENSSDIDDTLEYQEVEEYVQSDHKDDNITYEVILDHPVKDDILDQHSHPEDISLEHNFQAQMQDVSGHSSTGGEPPLKIIKSGFKNANLRGGSPSAEPKEIHQVNPATRKVRMTSNEPNILLERKKLVLQIRNEELRAYKLQLEAFKMERELGFGRSIFTKNLPTKSTL